jgi:hypothetical protein
MAINLGLLMVCFMLLIVSKMISNLTKIVLEIRDKEKQL